MNVDSERHGSWRQLIKALNDPAFFKP